MIGGIRLSEQETFQCIGCGATIQTENPDEIGYLPQSALNKGIEKGEFYCQRCFKLRHYNQLQDLDIDDDVFLNKLGEIANDDAFVVLVVDIFDVEGSLISGLHRFIGNQPFIISANKFDLLPKVTRKSKVKDWIRQTVNRHGLYPEDIVLTYGTKRAGIYSLAEKIEEVISDRNVYIVGVTNVGKSTLINTLARRKSAKTGNKPGITRSNQWIKTKANLELLDTPGILWPKFEDKKVGLNLAFTGAIKDEILDRESLALKLIESLAENFPNLLNYRYNVEINDKSYLQIMEEIGIKRGALLKGGEIDYTKVSNIILDEFRKGIIGRITLEFPEE